MMTTTTLVTGTEKPIDSAEKPIPFRTGKKHAESLEEDENGTVTLFSPQASYFPYSFLISLLDVSTSRLVSGIDRRTYSFGSRLDNPREIIGDEPLSARNSRRNSRRPLKTPAVSFPVSLGRRA